jgi:predicted protein tyrosine phosphatase
VGFPVEAEEIPPHEPTHSRLRLAWDWLTKRSPLVIFMRIYSQLARRITGVPVERYSQITPQLHICGQYDARGLSVLQSRGVTAVVNLRREFDDQAAGIAPDHYLHLPVEDNTAPPQEVLRRGVKFIADEINDGGSVYIHCGVGVGRAPTLAAAYLVSTGLTPDEAWKIIRIKRPFIWPNRRQLASVRQFAEGLE